MNKQMTVY